MTTPNRRRLTDILRGEAAEELQRAWETTQAAPEMGPVPKGEYVCRALCGELIAARTGTAGYKLTLQIMEGEYAGRRIWHDLWVTKKTMPALRRDLPKLGITDLAQLEQPLPQGIILRCKVSLQTSDQGQQFNQVDRFEFLCIKEPTPDPFAPEPSPEPAPEPPPSPVPPPEPEVIADEPPPPPAPPAASFDFGANVELLAAEQPRTPSRRRGKADLTPSQNGPYAEGR